MRNTILNFIYKLAPFNLDGDLKEYKPDNHFIFSCLIITGGHRNPDMDILLSSLNSQNFDHSQFEIIILNDNKNTELAGLVDRYNPNLNIKLIQYEGPAGKLGHNRNITIQNASGRYLLFLDDDTRIMDSDFLQKAATLMQQTDADIMQIKGTATFGRVKEKYDFLDKYGFAGRCCLYKRKSVTDIKGFNGDINSFEDHELAMRLIMKGAKVQKSDKLCYFHPPLIFDNMDKPLSFGQAIWELKKRYSFLLWIVLYLNTLRYLIYFFIPSKVHKQWFKLSLGVFLYPFKKKDYYY